MQVKPTRQESISFALAIAPPPPEALDSIVGRFQELMQDMRESGASKEDLIRIQAQMISQLSGAIARIQ